MILEIMEDNVGVHFCPDLTTPSPLDTIIICNDAAGFSEEDPDSFRGGCSIILIPGSKTSRVSIVKWDEIQLKNHSTCLEMVNGQRAITDILNDSNLTGKFKNVLEIYDNSAVVASNIRLGASSPVIRDLLVQRTKIVLAAGIPIKIFTMWRRRNIPEIAMCDSGSKGKLEEVDATLKFLELPPKIDWELPKPSFPAAEDPSS
jgi:hypothetical protein